MKIDKENILNDIKGTGKEKESIRKVGESGNNVNVKLKKVQDRRKCTLLKFFPKISFQMGFAISQWDLFIHLWIE